jgi:hypothetical protein
LQVQPVDLLTGLGRCGLGISSSKVSIAVKGFEARDMSDEGLLLLGDLELESVAGWGVRCLCINEIEERDCLVAGLS